MCNVLKEKCFRYVGILFILYVAPIILANMAYYNDDVGRLVYGWDPWSRDGRPMADIFYRIFSFGLPIHVDVYPLPLLVAIFLLAVAVTLLYRKFGNDRPWIFALCLFPLLANPTFLQNLYWRYDSAFMVLSIAFAIFPYTLSGKDKKCFIIGVLLLICSISFYQAAINVFIGMAAIEGYYNLLVVKQVKKSIQEIGLRGLQCIFGVAIYWTCIVPQLPLKQYNIDYSRLITLDASFLENLYRNFNHGEWAEKAFLQNGTKWLFLIASISFLAITLFFLFQSWREKKVKISEKLITIGFVAVQWGLIIIVAHTGALLFTQNPVLKPRVYVGCGACIAFFLLPHCWINTKHWLLPALVPASCAWYFFVFGYAANNVIKEDYRYQNQIALSVIQDINRLGLNDKKFVLSGNPKPPASQETQRAFPFISKLLAGTVDSNVLARNGAKLKTYCSQLDAKDLPDLKKMEPFFSSSQYSFYKFNDAIVIQFTE